MSASSIDRDLGIHLAALRREHGDTVKVDRIAEIVRVILDGMAQDMDATDKRLYRELEALAGYIHAAREEIAALRPQDIQNDYIASATDELDAIVAATESATNDILDAAEMLEALQADMPPDLAHRLTEATTRIYEASTFQDITGQRIGKVVKALKHIEEKIEILVQAFGPEIAKAHERPTAPKGKPSDEDLLNGPQLPASAANQADIDKLFSSFD